MPLFTNLLSLFKGGAVAIAEQFVRGFTTIKNFNQLMTGKYGNEYQVDKATQDEFIDRVVQASTPAIEINYGNDPSFESVPSWIGSNTPGSFIHTGLTRISVGSNSPDGGFQTHIPFTYIDDEILKLQKIIDRIKSSVDGINDPKLEKYLPDLDRLEQAITYHRNKGGDMEVDPTLYSVFIGE